MTNWILVPCRDNLHLTRAAVKTFLAQDIGDIRVLLVDNGSKDGTGPWARAQDREKLTYWHPRVPFSVAETWNRGLTCILDDMGCEYALVVNNDVELRPDTYRWLVEDGGGFVTAVGVTEKEKIQPISKLTEYLPPDPHKKRPHPDFSCYLIRKEVWTKVGPFDEKFKIAFCEDQDMHIRLHQAGIKAWCLDLPFLHHASQTVKNADPNEQQRIYTQARLNRDYFERKWGVVPGSSQYYALFGHEAPEESPNGAEHGNNDTSKPSSPELDL